MPINTRMTNETRLRLYEFLAAPAHAWLWCVARLLGGTFECGPADEFDD